MTPRVLALLTLSALGGCLSGPVSQPSDPVGALDESNGTSAICVLQPPDAFYNSKPYRGSGRSIGDRTALGIERAGREARIVVGRDDEMLKACHETGADLALLVELTKYEDRLTGWSGKPDQIALKLSLFELSRPDQRRVATYEAQSNTWVSAFLEWGNARPTALLGGDFDETVRRLIEGP